MTNSHLAAAASGEKYVVSCLGCRHAVGFLLTWAITLFFSCSSLVFAYEVKPLTEEQARQYKLDPSFYKKGTIVQDILIATSERVSDFAHREAAHQFDMIMQSIDPSVAQRVRDRKVLCLLIGHNEMTSDLPQFTTDKTGEELDFYNWRQRGFLSWKDGRPVVVFSEEDVLHYEGGMDLESILVHEFGHVVHGAGFDEELQKRLTETFKQAKAKGLWNDGRAAQRFRRVKSETPVSLFDALVKSFPNELPELIRKCLDGGDILVNGKRTHSKVKVTKDDKVLIVFGGPKQCYAGKNRAEYWAEGFQCWYDTNRTMDHDHNHIHTREQLKAYDPDLAKLCEEVLGDSQWRFVSPRQRAGKEHLKDYDPAAAPKVVAPEHIKKAANDYYDEYWKDFWQRLRDKYATSLASTRTGEGRAAAHGQGTVANGKGIELAGKSCIQAGGLGELKQWTLTLHLRPDRLPDDFNSILHTDGWSEKGLHAILRTDGQVQISVHGSRPRDWQTPVRLEVGSGRSYHLAIAYDSAGKTCRVFLDGKQAADVTYTEAVPVKLDRFCIGAWNAAERMLDGGVRDIRIYREALSAESVAEVAKGNRIESGPLAWWKLDKLEADVVPDATGRHAARLVRVVPPGSVVHRAPLSPEENPWADKGIPSRYPFGAYYTRKNVDDEWHQQSRTDEFADIMVRFADEPGELLFWRGNSYRPCWKTGLGAFDFPELVARAGDGPPARPDKVNRHTRARIIESTPERVTIHWRYMTEFPAEVGLENPPNQTKFVDEYFVISPDRTVIRGVRQGAPRVEDWRDPSRVQITAYRLTADGIEGQGGGDAKSSIEQQTALMHRLLGLDLLKPAAPKPAMIKPVAESVPAADVILRFDDASGRTIAVEVPGQDGPAAAEIQGHVAHWRTGVSGTALAFDGWTSEVPVRDIKPAAPLKGITLDAWIAIAAYPWNFCPIVQQGDVIREGGGWFLGIDPDGKPALALCIDGKRVLLQAPDRIPRFRWTHVTGSYDADKRRMTLYVDGRHVAETAMPAGDFALDVQAPLRVGQGPPMTASWPVGRTFGDFPYAFDGLIDEVRVFWQPLEARQVESLEKAFAPTAAAREAPDLARRKLPAGSANWSDFAAHYTHLNYHEAWDSLFRMGGHPDVVVTFDRSPVRYVLWHGVGYIPMMVTESGFWYSNEFNETWWRGCCEPMSDKKVVFGRVHILEQSPARVVLKWRYPLSNVGYQIYGEDPETGWGEWCDWYLTIYPDGTCAKRMRIYMSKTHSHEWHESMVIFGPEQHPEKVLETRPALVVGTLGGQVRRYDWIDAPPESVDYEDVILHVANMKARYDPYTILRVNRGNVYRKRGESPYSVFPAWNHWPVGQYPSDGRYVRFPDRAAHSSLTHVYWDFSSEFGQQGAFEEKILLEGMSDLPAEKLLGLARSFVDPPPLTPRSDGLAGVFEPAERAYKLTRASGTVKQMQFTLNATDQQPLVNPAFVVVNWGDDRPAEVLIDGKKPPESVDVRQGVVRRANGVTSLVVWTELTRASQLDVEIRMPE